MSDIKDRKTLQEMLKAKRAKGMNRNDEIRLHRAISWIRAGEKYRKDLDISFISYWNAYEACYVQGDYSEADRDIFLKKLDEIDKSNQIHKILANKFAYLPAIMDNKYIFRKYYAFKAGETRDWENAWTKERRALLYNIKNKNTWKVVSLVLYRLSALRNQMLHGSTTYGGAINRDTLEQATAFMSMLVPKMVELMFKGVQWGELGVDVLDNVEAKK